MRSERRVHLATPSSARRRLTRGAVWALGVLMLLSVLTPSRLMAAPAPIDLSTQMNTAYHAAFWNRSRFQVLYGGSGSGKSFFVAQKKILRLISECPHTILATRKVAATLRNSVFALSQAVINQWGLGSSFAVNKSDFSITYRPNGNQMLFAGLDDVEKLKSIAGSHGDGITSIWGEEATEFTFEDVMQLNLRMRGRSLVYKQFCLSFNPIDVNHWLNKHFFQSAADGRTFILKTTFEDNAFIDEDYKIELRRLKDQDEGLYRIYALGEWGVLKGLIYTNIRFKPFPEGREPDETIYGLDFGFNNPTALVRIRFLDGEVYVNQVIYQRGLTTAELIEQMRTLGVDPNAPIYADAAEPDRIEEIYRAGFNVFPAHKAKGSVVAGITYCKSLVMNFSPDSPDLIKEAQSYKWAVDRNGEPLSPEQPVKFNDHGMDALRYGIHSHAAENTGFFVQTL